MRSASLTLLNSSVIYPSRKIKRSLILRIGDLSSPCLTLSPQGRIAGIRFVMSGKLQAKKQGFTLSGGKDSVCPYCPPATIQRYGIFVREDFYVASVCCCLLG